MLPHFESRAVIGHVTVTIRPAVGGHKTARVGQKKPSHTLLFITSPNIDRFANFFHRHILRKVCHKLVTAYTTTP